MSYQKKFAVQKKCISTASKTLKLRNGSRRKYHLKNCTKKLLIKQTENIQMLDIVNKK